MPLRRIRGTLREIERSSRRVQRDGFDRAQGIAFVLAFLAAPLAVERMEKWHARDEREPVLLMRVAADDAGSAPRAQAVDFSERGMPWVAAVPLAEVEFTQRTSWHGWPFASRETDWPLEVEVRILGSGRETQRQRYIDAARAGAARTALMQVERPGLLDRAQPVESVHPVAMVFSFVVWWVLFILASAALIAPLKFAWRIYRRTRTHLRQSRIDRCHCPNCGYNARESILRGICPECGSELYERPDYDG